MQWVRLGLMLVFGLPSVVMAASPAVPVSPVVPPVVAVFFQDDVAAPTAAAAPEEESVSSGQEEVPAATGEAAVPDDEELTPAEKKRRKNFLSIAWLLLIGVGVVGLLLLLIVLFIGSSIRRMARQPAPQAPLRDQLWYLKPEANQERSGDPQNPTDPPEAEKKHDS